MATRVKHARSGETEHETDLVAWAEAQADALRAGRFDELDLENLAEEVADLSRREARTRSSRTSRRSPCRERRRGTIVIDSERTPAPPECQPIMSLASALRRLQ